MIKPRGVALALVAFLVLVLAGSTRIGWLLLFDSVLWGALAISGVLPWLASGRLEVRRRVVGWDEGAPGPMEGSPIEFEVSLHNVGLTPCMLLSVDPALGGTTPEGRKARLFLNWLSRGGRASSRTAAVYDRRGQHELGPVKTETTVPFGLVRRTKRVASPASVLVLPRVYPVESLDMLGSVGSADTRVVRARSGELVTGSRNYVPGDAWQHMHWRNTARTSQPQVKELERSTDDSLVIAFDATPASVSGDSLEDAIRIAASVGDLVARSGRSVRLLAGNAREDTTDRVALLTTLALLEQVEEPTLPALALTLPPFSDVFAIVRDTDRAGMESLVRMARSQHRITAIVLRGYDETNMDVDPSASLASAGIKTVESWSGDLVGGLASLHRAASKSAGPVATGSTSTTPSGNDSPVIPAEAGIHPRRYPRQ